MGVCVCYSVCLQLFSFNKCVSPAARRAVCVGTSASATIRVLPMCFLHKEGQPVLHCVHASSKSKYHMWEEGWDDSELVAGSGPCPLLVRLSAVQILLLSFPVSPVFFSTLLKRILFRLLAQMTELISAEATMLLIQAAADKQKKRKNKQVLQ